MNIKKYLSELLDYSPNLSQRELSKLMHISLGYVNKLIKTELLPVKKTKRRAFLICASHNKLISLSSNAFITYQNESLIENIIKKLNEAKINDITLLIDQNKEVYEKYISLYKLKYHIIKSFDLNHLKLSLDLNNCFIIDTNYYFKDNPFVYHYLANINFISTLANLKSYRFNKSFKLIKGNKFALLSNFHYINDVSKIHHFDYRYLDCLAFNDFNFYKNYDDIFIPDKYLNLITETFNCNYSDIEDLKALKDGMTNDSFYFKINQKAYIIRVAGKGANKLIDRAKEARVYEILNDFKYKEKLIYLNPSQGIKIAEYLEGSRKLNARNFEEVKKAMDTLKAFHNLNYQAEFDFDLKKQLLRYERLMQKSKYYDYPKTKKKILSLIDNLPKENYRLCHIDAVADNFLIKDDTYYLIDFEYSANQDPDIDIAMFCIYSLYNEKEIDEIISFYHPNIDQKRKFKIYAMIAICALIWSNWCEYKELFNINLGDYALAQYLYAKKYSSIVLGEKYD